MIFQERKLYDFPIDRKEEIWYILSREMKVLRHWKIT